MNTQSTLLAYLISKAADTHQDVFKTKMTEEMQIEYIKLANNLLPQVEQMVTLIMEDQVIKAANLVSSSK